MSWRQVAPFTRRTKRRSFISCEIPHPASTSDRQCTWGRRCSPPHRNPAWGHPAQAWNSSCRPCSQSLAEWPPWELKMWSEEDKDDVSLININPKPRDWSSASSVLMSPDATFLLSSLAILQFWIETDKPINYLHVIIICSYFLYNTPNNWWMVNFPILSNNLFK